MPIVSISSDPASLTLTAIGEYPVPVKRLWAAWTDPRQLERFWGPPQWPATFTRHDLREGGRADYHMTGPAGEVSRGWWVFERVEADPDFVRLLLYSDLQGSEFIVFFVCCMEDIAVVCALLDQHACELVNRSIL